MKIIGTLSIQPKELVGLPVITEWDSAVGRYKLSDGSEISVWADATANLTEFSGWPAVGAVLHGYQAKTNKLGWREMTFDFRKN